MSNVPTLSGREDHARGALFERYNRLNALYEKAEKRLSEMHIPRETYVVYDGEPIDELHPDYGEIEKCLGVQKIKGKWRICYASSPENGPGPTDWTPIVECSAVIRADAAHHLDSLRQAIVEAAEKFVVEVDKAISALEKFTEPKPSDEIRLALKPPTSTPITKKLRQ